MTPKFTKEFEEAKVLRESGMALDDIHSTMPHISRRTVSGWLSEFVMLPEIKDAFKARRSIRQEPGINKGNAVRVAKLEEARARAYLIGLHSVLTQTDCLFVGLYWGEGSKSERLWKLVNSDPGVIRQGVEWLRRNGHTAMRGAVIVYADGAPDDEIKEFWAACGILPEFITVYRRPAKSKRQLRKCTYGTCALSPSGPGSAALYEIFRGQQAQLTAVADKQCTGLQNQVDVGAIPTRRAILNN